MASARAPIRFEFNDELLLTDEDRTSARDSFPNVFFALDHHELRQAFVEIDRLAKGAKTKSQCWGMVSVVLAIAALVLAAFETVIHAVAATRHWPHEVETWLAMVAALFGVAAVVIAYMGVMHGKSKQQWLHYRLMTERLRQWHAQSVLGQISEIAAAAGTPEGRARFAARRAADFTAFSRQFLDKIEAEFPNYVEGHRSASDEAEEDVAWFRPEWEPNPDDVPAGAQEPVIKEVLDAYAAIRLSGQRQYTRYKLLTTGRPVRFRSHPAFQKRVLGRLAWSCVALLLVLHVLILAGALTGMAWMKSPLVHALAVSTAIVALGGRALEEGLQPHREVERLGGYLHRLDEAGRAFRHARSLDKRIEAARDVELAAVAEMIAFLRAHHESKFVM